MSNLEQTESLLCTIMGLILGWWAARFCFAEAGRFSIPASWCHNPASRGFNWLRILAAEILDPLPMESHSQRDNALFRIECLLPSVCADPTRIRQLLITLVDNAIKFTPLLSLSWDFVACQPFVSRCRTRCTPYHLRTRRKLFTFEHF